MNETLQDSTKKLKEWWGALPKWARALAVVLGIAGAGAAVVSAVLSAQDPYKPLFTDLQNEDSRLIQKKLGELNIPYTVTQDQAEIAVPESKIPNARMQLAKEGLPGQSVVGFEKFDGSTLGMSSYIQRIQYIRAIQGELTRSIERLAAVKRARVHISLPPKKTFLEEEEPPKASVVLELKPNQTPTRAEVRGIAHLVASAVEGLKVNQVTIVDSQSNFLHRPEDEGSRGLSDSLIELQRSIESEYQKRIEDILVPVVGAGKVKARVTAELDTSRTNVTEETYNPDLAVLKQQTKDSERVQGSKPNPVGIPGSRSNLPGTETQNPTLPLATSTSEKTNENKNYAIPKKIEVIDKPSGNIKRLTVAVLVDGSYKPAADGKGKPEFIPRTDDEIKQLQGLIANAVGYDQERRDSITVSSMPFSQGDWQEPEIPAPPPTWYSVDGMKANPLRTGLLLGIPLIMMIGSAFFLLRRRKKVAETPEPLPLPKTVAEFEAAGNNPALLALDKGAPFIEEVEPLEKKEEAELRTKIVEKLTSTPKKGLRIVVDWLEEDAAIPEPVAPQES